jgi:Dolichyl-phosphate-mannose-protein mannosyltransferase
MVPAVAAPPPTGGVPAAAEGRPSPPLAGVAARGAPRGLLRSPGVDALALFVLALAMRLPFQTVVLYHWDSVLYALALSDFDVAESRPHPPGYLFYVATARLAQLVLGDANASLVAVSLVGGALAVALTYLLGRQLYGRGVGIAAALLLAAAAPFWYYSGVAYPYTVLASGSVGLALLAVRYWRGGWAHPALLGLLYGLAGGFRTDLLLFLAPLLAVAHLAHCRRTGRRRDLLAPLPGMVVGVLLWLVPTAWLSEGWGTYLPLMLRQGRYVEGSYSLWSRGWPALQSNGWQVLVYAWEGLLLAAVPFAYWIGRGLVGWWRAGRPTPAWTAAPPALVLLIWVVPPALFYSLVHIGDRGYSFSLLPGLCIAAAAGGRDLVADLVRAVHAGGPAWLARTRRWARPPALSAALLALLLVADLWSFLGDHGRVSAYEMNCVNRTLTQSVRLLRQYFDPADTLIFSSFFYQHARYYLPGYRAWWYDPLTRPVFRERLPADVRHVVIFGEGLWAARQPNVSFYPLACDRRLYYFSDVEPGAQLVYRPPLLSVRPPSP